MKIRALSYLAAFALFGIADTAPAIANENTASKLQNKTNARATRQARFVNADGYRMISSNLMLMCRETLQSTLDCTDYQQHQFSCCSAGRESPKVFRGEQAPLPGSRSRNIIFESLAVNGEQERTPSTRQFKK